MHHLCKVLRFSFSVESMFFIIMNFCYHIGVSEDNPYRAVNRVKDGLLPHGHRISAMSFFNLIYPILVIFCRLFDSIVFVYLRPTTS